MSRQPPSRERYEGLPIAYSARRPLPGREALLLAGLVIGLLMLGIQLWLLTVALEMFLGGDGEDVWGLALISGLVFAGGIIAVWRLAQYSQVRG
jgi:uncharacterized protein DUF6755